MSENFDFNSLSTTPAANPVPKQADTTNFDFNSLSTPPPSTMDKVGKAISDAAGAGLSSISNGLNSAQNFVQNVAEDSGIVPRKSVMEGYQPTTMPRTSQASPVAPVNQAYFDQTKKNVAGKNIPDAIRNNPSAIARTIVAADGANKTDAANTLARAKGQPAPDMTGDQISNAALVNQPDDSPSLKDQYLSLGQGLVSAAQLPFTANTVVKNLATQSPVTGMLPYAAGKAADALGITKFDPAEALNDVNKWLGSQHSDQFNAEQKKPILSSDMQGVFDDGITSMPGKLLHTVMNDPVFGRGATSLSKIDGTVLQSLPSSVASMFPVIRAARLEYETGIAAGIGEKAAQHAAERMAMKAGAASEGVVGGLQQWQQTYDQVMGMPESKLQNSPAYQEARKYSSKDEARKHVATNAANVAGATAAAVDAPLAAFGDRYLGSAAAGNGTRLGSVARGIAQETPTETLQSMGEQLGTNLGVQQYADPNQKLGDQVMEQGAQGGLSGGLMGGGMGGISHVNTPSTHQQIGEALNQDVAGANFNPQGANLEAIQALSPNDGITPAAQTRSFLPPRAPGNSQVAPSAAGDIPGSVPNQPASPQSSTPASDAPSNALDASALLNQIDQPDETVANQPSVEAIAAVPPETQALWNQVASGMTTSADGIPSAYLQAGNVLHRAGIINNAVDFNSVVNDIKAVQAIGLPEAARQSAIKGVVKKYIAAAKPAAQAAPPAAPVPTDANAAATALEPAQTEPVSPQAMPAASAPPIGNAPVQKREIPVREGRDSLVGTIIKLGGINAKYMKDVTGESQPSKARAPIGLFTKNGHGLDDLATQLADYGYPVDTQGVDGGVSHLSELVHASLGGDHVYTPMAQEAMLAKDRQKDVKDQAKELGIRTVARKFSDIERDVLTMLTKKDAAEIARLDSEAADAFASAKAELIDLLDQHEADAIIDPIADKSASIRNFYTEATSVMLEHIERIKAARAEPENNPFGDSPNDSQVLEGNPGQTGQTTTGETGSRHEAAGILPDAGSNAAPDGLELTGQTHQEIAAEAAAAEQEKKRTAAEESAAEAAAKKARTDKEIAGRQQGSADNFQLGQSAEESLSGQGDVFNQPAKRQIRQGKVGMMLSSGEAVRTSSGRETTPFPQIKSGPRSTAATMRQADLWLMSNALEEARARGDKFNARQFEANLNKPSQSDKDSAEEYLFGQQPDVVPDIFKKNDAGTSDNASIKHKPSANTVFTEDAAAAARALLKKKLGQINTGIDPEVMQAGITLAGYHIEAGARSFSAYAKAMIEDLGEAVKPYLKSWYAAISLDPRAAGFNGLDSLADVQAADLAKLETKTPLADELKAQAQKSAPASSVDAAAHEAATSPHNDLAEPSQAMKQVGNYKLGHVTISGLDISIENPAGSSRSGTDASGKAWSVQLEHHYGYLKGTIGRDHEHIDVFVKPGTPADYAGPVFVIDQKKPGNGHFDEHKVVLGAATKEEATAIYRSNYEKGWDGVRSISEFSLPEFKDWLAHGDTAAPAADYNEITAPDNGQFQENANASSAGRDSEQHRQNANAAQPVGDQSVLDEPAGIEPAGSGAIQPDGAGRDRQHGSQGIPGSSAAADGERSDQQVHSADRTAGTAVVPARNSDSQRSDLFGEQGVYDDGRAADAVKGASESTQSLEKKIAAQRDAETIPVVYGDRANIDKTLPFLSVGQREDVHFSEKRLGKPDGYGVLFTNGTGTGKTYLGLGIAKRMVRQGKSNGLIVVPNDKMVEDWTDSAKNLGLTVRALDGVKDPGKGIAVTTYANFGQNLTLADRPIDWVITDESHNLMQNAQATDTESLNALQAITLHPDGAFVRARMLHRDLHDRLGQAKENYTALSKARKDITDAAELKANGIATEAAKARHDAILKEWAAKVEEVKSHIAAHQGKDRPRVVMLSATPFAYEKNVALAAGYLYQLGEQNTSGGYNTPSPMASFMIQHFGYRMRYGKLTAPEANVDSGLMQRQFNTYLRKEGVLSARILDVDHDYDRKFVLIPSAIGRKIDEGLEYLREEAGGRYYPLYEAAQKRFDYLSRLRLLEALKAEAAVSYIKEHHALGRKVVVFHDYNDGGAFNPFSFSHMGDDNTVTSRVKNSETGAAETATVKVNDLINEFNAKRPDLADINLNGFSNPIATLTRAFPDAMQFNGRIPKKDRRLNIQQFNDDNNPNANLLIVQSAANAGWSGHDTTGKHQRVVLNLGLPTAPTKAIQQEGRIYRVGQASDAMFRYMNTGTSWERMAFASTIARRASAAENMAMGEQARGLLASFIGAFEDSSEYPASKEDGKGGKALDRALAAAMSDFERAKTFYFGQQKKTSRNKSAEGADYFATPEPIGQKMVEWLDQRAGDSFLEPSAGHGAIARWFPEHHPRTIVEPSMELASRAALLTDAKLINDKFENLNTINKYDLIAMNPPFGVGGKTAIEHLDKAFKHLNDGGRIVALIPVGQSADKRFDEWMHGTKKAPVKPIGEHPILGPIYKGDTLKIEGYGDTAFVADRVTKDGYVGMQTKGGLSIQEMLTSDRIAEIKPTGTRTREVANAPHAYLRGDILLPASTFNRAGTGVMTRIVIIDKVADDKLSMGLQQSSTRDLTDAENINDLFDRIESMTALPRVAMPEKEQAREASQVKPAIQAKESVRQQDTQALQREAQAQQSGVIAAQGEAPTFEVQGDKLLTNAPAVTVTTAKGKELTGVLVQDKEMAKGIDKFTYKPQGMDGYLVRMRHVIRPEVAPSFSRAEDSTEASPLEPSKDQAAATRLNDAMVSFFKNSDWSHAYDQVQLPDNLHGLEQAVKAAFGTEVVAIVPTAQRFGVFNGINYGGINYINAQSNRGFINVVGHELYHAIKKTRPDLHAWFSEQAKQFYKNVSAYSDKLDALLQPGESKMSADAVEEELLADFTGDAMADPAFVAELAKQEPTKFRQMLKLVTGWLKNVAGKLSGKGLGSSEYFTDVQALRNHLNKMLLAYASGKSIEGMAEFTAPKFSANESEIKGNQAAASAGSTTAAGWKMLAGDMGIFKNLTPDSFDMEGAAREIDPGMRAFADKPDLEEEKHGIVKKWHITMPGKEPAFVQENNQGEVWVDAHHLASGSSGGTKLYLLVGSYAEANGKVFIGDPAGLSDIALIRRTENMLSLALRFGTTRFMAPHEYQMNPAAKLDSVLDQVVRPINWVVGDDKNNLNELLKTSQANTTKLMPEIKNVFYNFENGQFEKDGKRFTDFGGILQRGNDSLLQRGFSKILTGNNGATDGSPGERAPVGITTLKRTAVTNTLSRAARGGSGGELLARLSRIVPGGLAETPLREILYSRAPNDTPTTLTRTDPLFDNPQQATPAQSRMDLKGGALGDNSTWNTPAITRLDAVIHALQDKHIDMKRVIESIKQAGRSIADSANPYLQEELFHGRSAKRVEDFVNHELTPLTTEMRARNISSADLEHYLWARHAEERNIQIAKINPDMPDGGSGMDTKEANDYLDNLTDSQKRGFEALAKRIDAITAETRQTLVDYGLETKTTTDTWGNAYKHYVPLMREDMDHGFGNGTGQGYSIKGNSAKRATGSSRNVIHILANIAMQRERAIVRGEKNRVATAVVALAKLNPNPGFWETEKPPTIRTVSDVTGMVEDRVDHNYRTRDNVVVARINNGKGKIIEHAVVFNERNERAMRMVASLKNLDVNSLDGILASSAVITRYFSAINTQYNPVFGIINMIRDVQDASINLSSTPMAGKQLEVLSHVLPALLGMYSDIRKNRKGGTGTSKWAHLAEEYESEGGKTGFSDMFRNSADRAEAIEKALNPDWWQTTKIGKAITLGGLLNMPEKLLADHAVRPFFDWLSDYNDAMENATRLAAYKVARDNGMNKQLSASLAKNISVNFNRKGSKGQQLGALYSFFNAAVQGTARMSQTLAGPAGKRIIAGGVLFGVMQAIMMAMAGFDSQDDEPPEFIKARNTIIPTGWATGKHDYISIPMPLGFNILPNIGRLSAELVIAGGRDAGKYASNMINALIDSFDPISNAGMSMQSILPTVFDPFAALAENRDWTGKPIARTDFNTLHPTPGFTRTKDTASTVGKALAKATNFITFGTDYTPGSLSPTPDQIDYLISQVTGGVGREFSKGEQVSTALYNGTFDEVPTYKIPLAGRLYGNADGQASQGSKFYTNIIRLNGYEGEIKGREKNGGDVAKFIQENPEAKLVGAAISSEKQVSALRKHRHKLVENNAPHDRLKTIDSQITAVMKRLNEQVKKARTEAAP